MELNLRRSLRKFDEMRKVEIITNFMPNAEGSCLIKFGETHVICSATIDENVPPFLRKTGKGWLTAEYGMLPRSTGSRMQREVTKGKPDGRTQEIQRLIGRSLRASINTDIIGERQIIIDCDVIRADGGTRTAAITGGYVALKLAVNKALKSGLIKRDPMITQVAAISAGIVGNNPMVDLEYTEDSNAEVDGNFIMSSDGSIIEIQMTGEKRGFSEKEFFSIFSYSKQSIEELFKIQIQAIKSIS